MYTAPPYTESWVLTLPTVNLFHVHSCSEGKHIRENVFKNYGGQTNSFHHSVFKPSKTGEGEDWRRQGRTEERRKGGRREGGGGRSRLAGKEKEMEAEGGMIKEGMKMSKYQHIYKRRMCK